MLEQYALYFLIGLGALAALILLTLAFRTVAGTVKGKPGSRLGISEYQEVDKQRRLVLIRRDEVEHLVLIGGNQDLVIETGIQTEALQAEEAPATPRLRPADRLDAREPAVQEPAAERQEPELPRQEPARAESEQSRQEPAVVRPMPVRAAPRPAVFGDRPSGENGSGRTEPRLQAVPQRASQSEA
jgi:Meckel syndrome type 1 protein